MFGLLQVLSVGQEWLAGLEGITYAAGDTCQVEQGRAPPEIRAQVDGEIVMAAP